MLDLTFNPIARFYEAPIQLKANGGVFVVDDFGRQRIRPRDLLNHVLDLAAYQKRPPSITRELLDAACASYFLEESEHQASARRGEPVPVAGDEA
jgi:hypothetical protein